MGTNKNKQTIDHLIESVHAERQKIFAAYVQGMDQENAEATAEKLTSSFFSQGDFLENRLPNDPLRALKNLMQSYNSFYAYFAEQGGLSAVVSHYTAERYAAMIEKATTIDELKRIHKEFARIYLDRSYRDLLAEEKPVSERVNRYIYQNFMKNIDNEKIAADLFMSQSHMMRMYKKQTGMTVLDKLQETRIKESKSLLIQSDLSLTDIAFMVGYNSLHYFSQIFKKVTGQTPTAYREKYNSSN